MRALSDVQSMLPGFFDECSDAGIDIFTVDECVFSFMPDPLKDMTYRKRCYPGLFRIVLLIVWAGVFLFGCGASAETADVPSRTNAASEPSGPPYETPEFLDAEFHNDAAGGIDGAWIDTSCTGEGYVAVAAQSDSRLKFQVIKDDETYNYNMHQDGTPSVFPLQSGSGVYRFRIMQNIVDKKYAMLYETEADVVLGDEFQPFLRPSDYVNYTKDSKCVAKAGELAKQSYSQVDVIRNVYEFICKSVKYDRKKAETVQSGYLPDPDETMATGKGICFDYASLAAAMLRSQGIPTKVIFGYVSPNDVYHAWNMFYTEETGWVTAEFAVDQSDWTRMDLTFSANGSDSNFIGDGSNYSDVYQY